MLNISYTIPENHSERERGLSANYSGFLFDHIISQIYPLAKKSIRGSDAHCKFQALELADFMELFKNTEVIFQQKIFAPDGTDTAVQVHDRICLMIFRVKDTFVLATLETRSRQEEYFHFVIAGNDQSHVDLVCQELYDLTQKYKYEPPKEMAKLKTWYQGSVGPKSTDIAVEAPHLVESLPNYPKPVAEALTQLIADLRELRRGVHIWYGPPGTGKTTALRILTQELQDEAVVHLIIDSEQLLKGGAEYMMQLLSQCHDKKKAYVIALEDAGQLITVDAGQRHSEALGRVLNMVDGVLGQNSNVSILVTTNEPVSKLHPALLRPGRCGSQVEFRSFNREEALVWLADQDKPELGLTLDKQEYTLADLFSILDQKQAPVRTQTERAPIGFRA